MRSGLLADLHPRVRGVQRNRVILKATGNTPRNCPQHPNLCANTRYHHLRQLRSSTVATIIYSIHPIYIKSVVELRKRSKRRSEVVIVGGRKFRGVGNFEGSVHHEGLEYSGWELNGRYYSV